MKGGGGGWLIEIREILSTATSAQILNHEMNKKKTVEVARNYKMFA